MTAPSSGWYNFDFGSTSFISVVAPVSMDTVVVGKKILQYWNNCCAKDGGPGTGLCKWDGQEIVRYTATCGGSGSRDGYGGMVVRINLRQG